MRSPRVRDLTFEEVEQAAKAFKEMLQAEANRFIRRHHTAEALAALEGMEYIDKFLYDLKLRAGSQLHTLLRPPRAKHIRIDKHLLSKAK